MSGYEKFIAVLLCIVPFVSCAQTIKSIAIPAKETPKMTDWELIRVVDGDTIDARNGGAKEERVRLLRIDTREKGEEGYEVARDALVQLLTSKQFTVEFEKPNEPERDRFNRPLAYIFVDDVNINVEMVRQGYSRFCIKYGRGRYAEQFRAAEEEAKRERRGVWGRTYS